MNKDILELKPQNLPVYIYYLEANIALVYNTEAYELKDYSFSKIKVASNQPLKPGDFLDNNCCYYGNGSIEIIPDLCKKRVLGGAEVELRDYYGCQITQMVITYVGDDNDPIRNSCGYGKCRVFINLWANDLSDQMKNLSDVEDELTESEHATLASLRSDLAYSLLLDYWQERISDWDKRFEYIGEVYELDLNKGLSVEYGIRKES